MPGVRNGTRRRRGLGGIFSRSRGDESLQMSMPRDGAGLPPRLADGAEFHARIDPVEEGYRAACWAELHTRDGASLEEPEIWLWQSDDDARAWIEQRRRERLFPLVMWEE